MRSSRMRGYGAWCMGWNDAQKKSYQPNNNNSGCLIIFLLILSFSFFKVAIETGNFLGMLFGALILLSLFKN